MAIRLGDSNKQFPFLFFNSADTITITANAIEYPCNIKKTMMSLINPIGTHMLYYMADVETFGLPDLQESLVLEPLKYNTKPFSAT